MSFPILNPVSAHCDLSTSHPDRKLLRGADMADLVPIWNHDDGITKGLPNGLWGFYDPNADPSSNKNNPDLLNGTEGGTTLLLAGVNLTHPDPVLSTEDTTQPFEYVPMAVENAETVDFPALVPVTPTFEAQQPDMTGKQWADVAAKWANPLGPVSSVDFVDLWAQVGTSMLGWDAEKISRKAGDDVLTGKAPTAELLKNIDGYLLWAPMMTQVATAA